MKSVQCIDQTKPDFSRWKGKKKIFDSKDLELRCFSILPSQEENSIKFSKEF